MPETGNSSTRSWAEFLTKIRCIAGVTGWASFEPWLSRIESFPAETAWAIAEVIPPEWYGGDLSALEDLLARLQARRARVRELIMGFRESKRQPFPNWGVGEEKMRQSNFSAAKNGCTMINRDEVWFKVLPEGERDGAAEAV